MKAVVLLSGGLDSIVNFKCALDEGEILKALTCNYGQVAFEGEARAASECARRYGVMHEIVDLGFFRRLVNNPIAGDGKLKPVSHADIRAGRRSMLEETWVPNRNAVLVAVGAAFAESLGAGEVVAGFNLEEAGLYPDNSAEFVRRINAALEISTLSGVAVKSYTLELNKKETVALGLENGAPLEVVYSCYEAPHEGRMCGVCQSCMRLKASFDANGVLDRYLGRFAA
ncbi:MAG: 7-cyano-7-deazaguanine synthase QueC [bacterium]